MPDVFDDTVGFAMSHSTCLSDWHFPAPRVHWITPLDRGEAPNCSRYAAAVRQAMVRTRAIRAARSVVEITPRASSKLKSCEHLRQWSYVARIGYRLRSVPSTLLQPSNSSLACLSWRSNSARTALASLRSKL